MSTLYNNRPKITTFAVLIIILFSSVWAGLPTTLNDFFIPGSQPNQSGNLETPDKCDNCHGGYDTPVEPAFNWRGGMMAQAARDPLYLATMSIANQDAAESGDLCIRCHFPAGWLGGRSVPTDGSALNSNDREGVQCDFCHKLVKPFEPGSNPYPGDSFYTADTYTQDSTYLSILSQIPPMSGNGGYITDGNNAKRGPFFDAQATHQMFYSPFHSKSDLCGTCHDVSNPAYTKDSLNNYVPNDLDTPSPSFNTYDMFPVERTYSEWKFSAFNTVQGIYAPQFGGNKDYVATCQDCHMRDVSGYGCNKNNMPYRDDLPLHDLTGGNTFVPLLIESVYPGEADLEALDSGIVRANYMLQNAASLDLSAEIEGGSYLATVRVTNETGHKLPSGYPEGRRIWINLKAYNSSDDLIYESGKYIDSTGELIHDTDVKIFEVKPGLDEDVAALLGYEAGPSFHFVLNNKIYFDNRIPPRGFTNANFEMIQSPPVGYSYPDSQYWDDSEFLIPGATALIEVSLLYQTTSKEYVEFLRDENITDNWGQIMYDLWSNNGKSAPVVMNNQQLIVEPLAGNQPPSWSPIGPRSTDEGINLTFIVSASDPDGTIPVLYSSLLPDSAFFTDNVDGSGTFDWMPSFDQAGIYDIIFYAADDSGAVDSESVAITIVDVNRAPVMDFVNDTSGSIDEQIELVIAAADPDGDSLTIFDSNLPAGAAFVYYGWDDLIQKYYGIFSWTPDSSQVGTFGGITFICSDGSLTDSIVISITVSGLPYICGDANSDEAINIFDITFLIAYLYKGGPAPEPLVSADVNGDGDINIFDATYLLSYLYKGGPAPACQ